MIVYFYKTNTNSSFISRNKITKWFNYTDYSFVYLISIKIDMLTLKQTEHFDNHGWCFYDLLPN